MKCAKNECTDEAEPRSIYCEAHLSTDNHVGPLLMEADLHSEIMGRDSDGSGPTGTQGVDRGNHI